MEAEAGPGRADEADGLPERVHDHERLRPGGDLRGGVAEVERERVGSTITSTGVAPAWTMMFPLAGKLKSETSTSSPGPMSAAARARWSAVVAEVVAIAFCAPT